MLFHTGLDSSTTLTIVKILANFCHLRQATMTVALLQPAPEAREPPLCVMLLNVQHREEHTLPDQLCSF